MCCDYEEILVQERIQTLEVGTMPRSITVILLNDLVDTCKVIILFTLLFEGRRRYCHYRGCETAMEAIDSR